MLSELSRMIRICCRLIFYQSYVVHLITQIFFCQNSPSYVHILLFFFYFTFKLTISCVLNDVNEYYFSSFLILPSPSSSPCFFLFVCRFEFFSFYSLVCLHSMIGLSIDTVAFIQRKYFVSINCPSLHHVYIYISLCTLYNIDIIFFFVSFSVYLLPMCVSGINLF